MSSFFVRRPIFALVISIIIVIVGVLAMQTLPIAQYPDITPPEVEVTATYTGADSVTIEESVATPLEQKVNGVEDMIYLRSVNSSDGKLALRVSFEVGTDLDMANVLVQNRVSEAQASLPEEVKRLGVTIKKKLSFPLMLVSLYSPNDSYDADFLSNYANINLVDALSRIRGVGQVNLFGGSDYAMRIWIRPDQLAKLNMSVSDVIYAVQQQNVVAPGGQIGGPPAPPGTEFTYTVRTKSRLESAADFENVILRSNEDGSQVRIKDVARVELGTQLYDTKGRFNGQSGAIISIYQQPGANGLEVAGEVRATMEQMKASFPSDLDYEVSLDTTAAITAGIDEIILTLIQALALVILVVFIFLQSWRATLIPLIAIPVSLIGAFAFFPMLGFSINVLSLLGLVLAIGIVVDDAIVVVEAVTVNIEKGHDPKQATILAMEEVAGPVIGTTLILLAVFVPVGTMGGITGRLYQQFAITIAVSVAISSINALTLAPALSSLLLRPAKESRGPLARGFALFNRGFDKTTNGYIRIASMFTKKMLRGAVFVIAAVVGAVLLGKQVPAGFMPEEDQGYFLVNVQLPDAASLQRTDALCKRIEGILGGTEDIDSVTTVVGYSMLTSSATSNYATFFCQLKPWDERPGADRTARTLAQQLNGRFAVELPEGVVYAFGPPPIPGLGTGAGFSIMLQDRSGDTPQYLAEQAEKFIAAANKRPEIVGAYTTYRANVPQVFADIDREKVLKLGIPISDVNSTLASFLGGAYVNDFNRFGRLYKVYVQAEPEYRNNSDGLRFFFVSDPQGNRVPLGTLVKLDSTAGPVYTNRFNLFRAAEIGGAAAPGYSSAQALDALEEVAREVLPPEISYDWNAMSYQEKVAGGSAAKVFLLALLFVFLILAALYESWSLPFSVLLGTPFAVFGAFLFLWISRMFSESYVNNVFAQIGLVMLIGMGAKNAILIVEFARAKKQEGFGTVEAAVEAARLRFRPILMTAFSFILGVLPLLVATGAGSEARKVIGMCVFGGMLMATVLGVFFVPMMFVAVENLAGGFGRNKKVLVLDEDSDDDGRAPDPPGPTDASKQKGGDS